MVICRPRFGLGVRHIQYCLLAIMNCMDFWIQELNFSLYARKSTTQDSTGTFSRKGGEELERLGSFYPTKIEITTAQSAFIYTTSYVMYTLGRAVSAFILVRVSNKYLLLGCITFENVTGVTLVWFVKHVRVPGIAAFLFITSFSRSMHTPLMYSILGKWMPPCDYTTAFCIITVTKELFTFFLSHYIAEMNFKESSIAFLLLTFVYFGWCAMYMVFGAESPQTSLLISKQEWNYLARNIGQRKKINYKAKIPWKSIFMCCILYPYIVFDFGKEVVGRTVTSAVRSISGGADIKGPQQVCLQAALMIYCIALLISCVFIDKSIRKQRIEAGPIRKVMTTVGSCGLAIMMILTAYVDSMLAKISYLFLAQCCFMIVHTAEPAILFDLSPNYAAVIYAGVSVVRNFILFLNNHFINPAFKTFDLTLKGSNLTTHIGAGTPDGMIYRNGFLIFFTNLFFIISGNIGLRDFDSYDTYDWRKESIISYP